MAVHLSYMYDAWCPKVNSFTASTVSLCFVVTPVCVPLIITNLEILIEKVVGTVPTLTDHLKFGPVGGAVVRSV